MILTLPAYVCFLQRQISRIFLNLKYSNNHVCYIHVLFNAFLSQRFKAQQFLKVLPEPWGCWAYPHHHRRHRRRVLFQRCSSFVVHSLFLKLSGRESRIPRGFFPSFGLCLKNSASAMRLFLLTLLSPSLAMVLPLTLFERLLRDTKGSCSSMVTGSVSSEHWGLPTMLTNWASLFIPTVRRWSSFLFSFFFLIFFSFLGLRQVWFLRLGTHVAASTWSGWKLQFVRFRSPSAFWFWGGHNWGVVCFFTSLFVIRFEYSMRLCYCVL